MCGVLLNSMHSSEGRGGGEVFFFGGGGGQIAFRRCHSISSTKYLFFIV